MIYFYYGDDTYRARQMITQLRDKFKKLYDPAGHQLETIDSDEFSLERFFTSAKSSGLFAKKKMIIVKNIFSCKEFSDIQDEILAYLKSLKNTKDENYLIFWHEGTPKRTTKLFKYLSTVCADNNCMKEFTPLPRPQLVRWLQTEAGMYGKKLDTDAAEMLISLVGESTWYLHHEVRKLCHFHTQESINAKDVEALIKATHGESIFSLMDAITARQRSHALDLLEKYLMQKSDRHFLLNMMIRQFRLIVLIQGIAARTRNSYIVAQQLGLHPFVAKKMLEHSKNFTRSELRDVYGSLIQIEHMLKRDPEYLETALTVCIAKL
ncbi:MAG: DNA polymerase III subunit delta [Patescibacteria group bacterium]